MLNDMAPSHQPFLPNLETPRQRKDETDLRAQVEKPGMEEQVKGCIKAPRAFNVFHARLNHSAKEFDEFVHR
jgi:hypothetical protein